MLEPDEIARYARQLLLPEIGPAGQQKLKTGRVLIIGAGGLGSPAAMYLAAAGLGGMGLWDGDIVEASNLNRQLLHGSNDLGRRKTASARDSLLQLNPRLKLELFSDFATQETLPKRMAGYDFVLDCTDSFAAKFMINDVCVGEGKAFCHAGVSGFSGQLMTWLPGSAAPCYRCIFKAPPPPSPPEARGVLGAAVGVIGALQAMEAIKFITGTGELLSGTLLSYNALTAEFLRVKLPAAADCPACGHAEAFFF